AHRARGSLDTGITDVALEQVAAPEPSVDRHVLSEVGELEADADVVAERHGGGIANIEQAEHDAADRGGREHAVTAQRGPILVGIDALILQIGVDQVDERLRVQPEPSYGVIERNQDRVGALIVVEALARFVAPAAQPSHCNSAVTTLIAEVVRESAERVYRGEVATQRSR